MGLGVRNGSGEGEKGKVWGLKRERERFVGRKESEVYLSIVNNFGPKHCCCLQPASQPVTSIKEVNFVCVCVCVLLFLHFLIFL